MLKLLPTITFKFLINSLFMLNVQIIELEFETCFFLENVLRSHGSSLIYDQVKILFKILKKLIHGRTLPLKKTIIIDHLYF